MRKRQAPLPTPFSSSSRLGKALRLLIIARPGDARQCLAAMAKVQGASDITVVETLEDAFCAVENAHFDAIMFEVDDLDGPIDYLMGPLKRGVLGPERVCPLTIAVGLNGAAVAQSPNTAAYDPDLVLSKPLSFDKMRRALVQAVAIAPSDAPEHRPARRRGKAA